MSYSSVEELRKARNTKLANTDKFFRPDMDLSYSQIQDILQYCKALRNIMFEVTDENVSKVKLPEPPQLPSPYNNYF